MWYNTAGPVYFVVQYSCACVPCGTIRLSLCTLWYNTAGPVYFVVQYSCACGTIWLSLCTYKAEPVQGFPQDKIVAGCSVFIAGHMALSGLIFSTFQYIFDQLLDINVDILLHPICVKDTWSLYSHCGFYME